MFESVALIAVGVLAGVVAGRRSRAAAAPWFSMSSDLMCTAGFDGFFTSVNESWSDLLGYSREELLGRPYTDFVHPDDVAKTNEAAAGLEKPSVLVDFENRYRARDGSWHWLLWSARSDKKRIYAVAKDITARKQLEAERVQLIERVKKVSQTDDLTGLLNRHGWHLRLKHELLRAERSHEPLAVVLIDLDDFKVVNDTLGHQAGDRLLKRVASAWETQVRATDCIGRLGGDEFALLLPNCGARDAHDVLNRLRESMPDESTCSMGIATWDGTEPAERLLLRADKALYSAKRQGRDRVAS